MDPIFTGFETLQAHAIPLLIAQRLQQRFPEKYVLSTTERLFRVDAFAQTGAARRQALVDQVNVDQVNVDLVSGAEEDFSMQRFAGHERVEWEGHSFELFTFTFAAGFEGERVWQWVVAASQAEAQAFYLAVVEWNHRVHGELLIFEGGCFCKSKALQDELANFSVDDLVLARDLGQSLRADLRRFLDSKALYAKAKVPWKRGLLFLGPPGNGKTHAVKGLLREAGLPCLYVKSFSGRGVDPHDTIPEVFERARALAPCVLVLEDLDALIDDDDRALLLNELDGFARNEGLITIATTNHPERLDPSLLHRPSRFDRKFHFALPEFDERLRYLTRWAQRLEAEARPAESTLTAAAMATAGFTFAYLKEATLSSLVQWVSDGRESMNAVLPEVIEHLRAEIAALPPKP